MLFLAKFDNLWNKFHIKLNSTLNMLKRKYKFIHATNTWFVYKGFSWRKCWFICNKCVSVSIESRGFHKESENFGNFFKQRHIGGWGVNPIWIIFFLKNCLFQVISIRECPKLLLSNPTQCYTGRMQIYSRRFTSLWITLPSFGTKWYYHW